MCSKNSPTNYNSVLLEEGGDSKLPVSEQGKKARGAWVAQSVKPPSLTFSSGHDLMVHGFKP